MDVTDIPQDVNSSFPHEISISRHNIHSKHSQLNQIESLHCQKKILSVTASDTLTISLNILNKICKKEMMKINCDTKCGWLEYFSLETKEKPKLVTEIDPNHTSNRHNYNPN